MYAEKEKLYLKGNLTQSSKNYIEKNRRKWEDTHFPTLKLTMKQQ